MMEMMEMMMEMMKTTVRSAPDGSDNYLVSQPNFLGLSSFLACQPPILEIKIGSDLLCQY